MNRTETSTFAYGFSIADLYERDGLRRLDEIFLKELGTADPSLLQELVQARARAADISRHGASDLAIRVAPKLESFIANLFGVDRELQLLQQRHSELELLFRVKREFVQRQAAKKTKPQEAAQLDAGALLAELQQLLGTGFTEQQFACKVNEWMLDEAANARPLWVAQQYAAWAVHTPAGRQRLHDGLLFKIPNAVDPIIAIATLDFGNVILTYSTLAFLGIGIQVGIPEWGSMTSEGLSFIPRVWWYTLFPGLAIMAVVVCFSILGDRLQDLVGGRLSY